MLISSDFKQEGFMHRTCHVALPENKWSDFSFFSHRAQTHIMDDCTANYTEMFLVHLI